MPPKQPTHLKLPPGRRVAQNVSFSSEPDSPPSPVDRTPSGMILTSSGRTTLGRQRSLSATGPLFTPVSSISNWADEMDKQDARVGVVSFEPVPTSSNAPIRRPGSPVERLQSGLALYPQLPPNYVPLDIHSSFGVPKPGTRALPPDMPPNMLSGMNVLDAHDPYDPSGRRKWITEERTQTFMDEYEEQLKDITVAYLMDKDINRYQGSVPVEKIQNILRCQHRDLYDKVVGSKHRSWNKFVEKHQDTFELFSIEDGKWRMRLTSHRDYKLGDQREKAAREAEDAHFLKALTQYLMSLPERSCKVDDFIAAYPDLPCNTVMPDGTLQHPLPKRGDFVRFVKRHSKNFAYDQTIFMIRLIPQGYGHGHGHAY